MTEILQRLVGEDISIRNMRSILEAMVEWGQKEKDVVQLTEYIRSSLKRYICYKYANGNNILPAYLFDQEVEEKFVAVCAKPVQGVIWHWILLLPRVYLNKSARLLAICHKSRVNRC